MDDHLGDQQPRYGDQEAGGETRRRQGTASLGRPVPRLEAAESTSKGSQVMAIAAPMRDWTRPIASSANRDRLATGTADRRGQARKSRPGSGAAASMRRDCGRSWATISASLRPLGWRDLAADDSPTANQPLFGAEARPADDGAFNWAGALTEIRAAPRFCKRRARRPPG